MGGVFVRRKGDRICPLRKRVGLNGQKKREIKGGIREKKRNGLKWSETTFFFAFEMVARLCHPKYVMCKKYSSFIFKNKNLL